MIQKNDTSPQSLHATLFSFHRTVEPINANPLISIPATLESLFFSLLSSVIFKLAAMEVFGIWQQRQRKFEGDWSSSGRKAAESTDQ